MKTIYYPYKEEEEKAYDEGDEIEFKITGTTKVKVRINSFEDIRIISSNNPDFKVGDSVILCAS